jgi:ribosomal protein S11
VSSWTGRPILAALAFLALPAGALAQAHHHAHVHGVAKVDVVVDGGQLVIELSSPLDSIVGFEHRPRTAAQRQAAEAAIARLKDGATLWRPDAAAQCTLAEATLQADALKPEETPPAKPAKTGPGGAKEPEAHADLDARYVFRCTAPNQLAALEHGLFTAFKGMQRIEVQVAGPQGQSRATLRRPVSRVALKGR